MSAAIRSVSRRLATAGAVHGAQGGTLAVAAPVRRPVITLPARGYSASSAGITSIAKETGQRLYKAVLRSTPFMASVTTYATVVSAVGYWVIETVEGGVNKKLVEQNNTLAVKLEAEKVKREGFQSIATHAHQESARRIDESMFDVRLQLNKLFLRWLEGHEVNLKRMKDMEQRIDALTREVDALKKSPSAKCNYVEDGMDIYSGNSYSVLLTTDQDPSSNYWVSIKARAGSGPALNYQPNRGFKLLAIAPPVTPAWNDTAHNKAFMSHDPDQSSGRHAPNRR
ncbi:unnamed protein product [Triticum turgidum subsp. durum]|uniref:Plastocyanin-like domain-containing protein n=1 Tax=Triticum turgidum subsp. durum TaxID=4567 RepID=A0A9R1S5E7_TRITD|nr:unnamed protein product [Triticum turgidum subsp. durum]